MKLSPRDRRLAADAKGIAQLVYESSIFQADGRGNPPTQYRFRFHGPGLAMNSAGHVVLQMEHLIQVELGAAYPRLMPALHWKTPIFHPNISTNGVVCLGGYGTHWVPSLTLPELCNMIWDMIRMKNFDIKSPYNRDAAAWVRDHGEGRFPLDQRPLRDRVFHQRTGELAGVEVVEPRSREPATSGQSTGTGGGESVRSAGDAGREILEEGIEIIQAREKSDSRPSAPILFIE